MTMIFFILSYSNPQQPSEAMSDNLSSLYHVPVNGYTDETNRILSSIYRHRSYDKTHDGYIRFTMNLHIKYTPEQVVKAIGQVARPGTFIDLTLLSKEKVGYAVSDEIRDHYGSTYKRLRYYNPDDHARVLASFSF